MGAIDSSIVNVALPQIRGAVGATRAGDHLDHHRLRHRHGARHAAHRVPRPPLRAEARLHGRAWRCSSSARCCAASPQSLPSLVALPRHPGLRRRRAAADRAGHPAPDLPARRSRAWPWRCSAWRSMIGPAIGPTLGGYIVDNYHWSWIFFINLPVGVLGLLHGVRASSTSPRTSAAPTRRPPRGSASNLDWQGIALLCVGLAALQYVLEEGQPRRLVRVADHHRGVPWWPSSRPGRLRHPRADRAGAGGQPAALQGPGLPLGHPHRRGDVRDADVEHVPAAGLHAGAARLHGHAVRAGADAAHARHDGGRCPSSAGSTTASRRGSSSPSACCCYALGAWQHEPLHARRPARRGIIGTLLRAGRRLRLPVRAAHHGRRSRTCHATG